MSLWTPYLEEPMDLRKHNKTKLTPHDWVYLPDGPKREEDLYREYTPVCSPPQRDTSSPGSSSSFDAGHVTEDPEYQQFERDALQAMAQSNGGSLVNNNPRMRRDIHSAHTDDQYRQQRQRNNMAAKKSRDRRKIREVRLGIQVAYLTKKLTELQNRLAERVCMHEQTYVVPYK